MEGSKVFISSCSRRQLARRRSARRGGAQRLQLVLLVLAVGLGFAAFLAGHGGI
ncbi:MAG: hypothetical protein ACJ76X_17970 [Solirubrobacteraceae bacterium]